MPNLRIMYDNAVPRATLAASSQVGALVVDNLKVSRKSSVWRSAGLSETITATWGAAEFINMVSLPFCNLSSASTMRVRGYTNAADAVPIFDTGDVYPVPSEAFSDIDWGAAPLGANAFSYGGGTYATVWTTLAAVKKLVIDINDPLNQAGYLESAILVAGKHWSTKYNPDYGVQLLMVDNSKHERNDAGDLMTVRGTRNRKLTMSLNNMQATDRNEFLGMVRGNGLPKPIFVSLFPESDDPAQDQLYQIYGKLATTSPLNIPSYNAYASAVDLEEI